MLDDTSSRVLRGDTACNVLRGRGDAWVRAEVGGKVIDSRVQVMYVPDKLLSARAVSKPTMSLWPEFDPGPLEKTINRMGRPVTPFTDEQIACAIHAAQNGRKGRDALAKMLYDQAQPITGVPRLTKLLAQGRKIADCLEELES